MTVQSIKRLRIFSLAMTLALILSTLGVMPASAVINASSFAAAVQFTGQNRPIDAAIGDLDGDGRPDIAVANEGNRSVSVLRNISTPGTIDAGSFVLAGNYPGRAGNVRSVALGDLNADGRLDMAASNYDGYYVNVWRNTSTLGTISFAARQDFAATRYNNWVAFSDIDGNGRPDLIISSLSSNGIYVLRNTNTIAGGAITFDTAVFFATGNSPWIFGVGDIDGDGLPDLAVCNQGGNTVTILRNTSTPGSISFATTSIAVAAPYNAAIADLDGDGMSDLAVLNASSVLNYRNTGSAGVISFAAPITYVTTSGWDILAGDIDVDGRTDLVLPAGFSVLPNNSTPGTISFLPAVIFGGGSRPGALGDLDVDGRLDVVLTNWVGTTISVHHNTTPPVVTIDSISPNPTNAGTTVNWHADMNGTYSLRVGGTDCATGTEVENGTYSTSPATVNSVIGTGDLVDGTNTLWVCVTNPQGNTGSDSDTVVKETTAPALNAFARQSPAVSPTNADTLVFRATFSEDVQNVDAADFTVTGTTAPITGITTVTGSSVYDITITGGDLAGLNGTVGLDLAPGQNITDLVGNALPADEPGIDETYLIDNNYPTVLYGGSTSPANGSVLFVGPTQIVIEFNKDVLADGSADAADFTANYLLVEAGVNGTFETVACGGPGGGLQPGDLPIVVNSPIIYSNSSLFISTLTINNGTRLPVGNYRLFICGTSSIYDLAGNRLNNGLDSVLNFSVARVTALPATGFTPGMVTLLPAQPAEEVYEGFDGLWLEIPRLGVKMDIVGVPFRNGSWDVTWLGQDAGWLEGSAFPTWAGNSVLTGHVWNADNTAGNFRYLNTLLWGDKVIIHAYGAKYIYEVRRVTQVKPDEIRAILKHEELPWLTLVTCRGYDEKTGEYQSRILVRAVLVELK